MGLVDQLRFGGTKSSVVEVLNRDDCSASGLRINALLWHYRRKLAGFFLSPLKVLAIFLKATQYETALCICTQKLYNGWALSFRSIDSIF